MPRLLFFFDIEPEISLKRISSRGQKEIYEKIDFLKRTKEEYEKVLAEYNGTEISKGMKIVRIDATADKEKISRKIEKEINSIYKIF